MKDDIVEPPEWLPIEIWKEWIDYRRTDKKKEATKRSQKMFLNKLERLHNEYDPVKLIETAIEQEWLTVFPREDCRYGETTGSNKKQSAVERVRAKAQALRRNNIYAVGNTSRNVRN